MQYRTEIVVAEDRYVCLQLPQFIPAGRATVTVIAVEPTERSADDSHDEGDEIEWWEELDADNDSRGH